MTEMNGGEDLVNLVPDQNSKIFPEIRLENGALLKNAPVAYKTWGKLNETATNAMVICHALTGSSDVEDWWGPLIGPGKAFDTCRFFIFCANVLGSPYGSASPVTINPDTGNIYGPEFPVATIRDDVRIHREILEELGVKQVAIVIGGSMGGMQALEWAFHKDFVRTFVPMATSAQHSAWCISWGEAQRQAIYSDPNYNDGYYTHSKAPLTGLATARMAALLTYRSSASFESRFGRRTNDKIKPTSYDNLALSPRTPAEEALYTHNDGHRNATYKNFDEKTCTKIDHDHESSKIDKTPIKLKDPSTELTATKPTTSVFSAQSYLRYQGDKFVKRFDANCYINITRKMDTHDVFRGRSENALSTLTQPALVIGIESDGLFPLSEQEYISKNLPNARFRIVSSPDGHDGFLLEFAQIQACIKEFMADVIPELYHAPPLIEADVIDDDMKAKKSSVFGEAEVEVDDVSRW